MSVSNEIIKVLDALAEKFGLAIDWTSKNVVPYLEELCCKYINYEVATSIVFMVIGISLLILAKCLPKRIKGFYEKSDELDPDIGYSWLCILLSIVMVISIVVGLWIFIQQTFDIITCYTIPEKILIEEIMKIYNTIK